MSRLQAPRAYLPFALVLLLWCGCANLGIYRLELRALPEEGPAPLTVSFVAEIIGGLDTMPELYCRNPTWDLGDGHLRKVFGLCRPWRPGTKIDRRFGQYYTYQEPGAYQAAVHYGPLKSEPVLIRVLE